MNDADLLSLDGQIAFVTGAGQGAGRGIALALARHNAGGVAVKFVRSAEGGDAGVLERDEGVGAKGATSV